MIRPVAAFVLVALAWAWPVRGQTPLTLEQAIARAADANPDARIAASVEQEAVHRVTQARSGYLPRADVAEAWQRGNQPVFVFGSLLAQRRFTAADFALEALNRPDAVDNFRAAIGLEQTLFDGGATGARVRAARAGVDLAASGRTRVAHALAVSTTEAYGQVLLADAAVRTARTAVDAADADLERTRHRRDAGLVTEADVLAIEVHRARVEEALITATAATRVARAQLNRVMGAPLDDVFTLSTIPPAGPGAAATDLAALEAEAVARRPEVADAGLRTGLAEAELSVTRAAYLPQVVAQAGWETNGSRWGTRAGSWIVGTGVRLNLFRGLADRARLAEATEAVYRQGLEREQAETAVRLEVRTAAARLEAAHARQALAGRVVAQAQESQRIMRDRYEQGLVDVTALLRAAESVMQAEEQQVRARVDVLVGTASLDRAAGRQSW
jgi:outer membrane protein